MHAKRAKVVNYVKVGDGWSFANVVERDSCKEIEKGTEEHQKVVWKTGV